MNIAFEPPLVVGDLSSPTWHERAVARNHDAANAALEAVCGALMAEAAYERVLLRAAAGAGKSHTLKHMVGEVLKRPLCRRVGITAFANKQIFPLAGDLGRALGKGRVCLYVSKGKAGDVGASVRDDVTVVSSIKEIPTSVEVLVATSHMLGRVGSQIFKHLGPGDDGKKLFDVLFVDEAWQLPLYLYRDIDHLARVDVGVGDVGQLPPLDPGENPWRGDPGYNPYRAWPTDFDRDRRTWSVELPAVWRPRIEQLALWRAFYPEWDNLDSVAGPGDRSVDVEPLADVAAQVWAAVASGVPTLVEVEGLPDPEAPDVDTPLLGIVEEWLDELFGAGFTVRAARYSEAGMPDGMTDVELVKPAADPLVAVLATRNQAVDDATAMVARLIEKHDLTDGAVVASTVDSWQGQTNAITVAIHPLSGASQLDEFNSAFGRLAVTCTRATHGLLLVSRARLDELLDHAAARPGTPFGEPGNRRLPRQTHQRILQAFQRAHINVSATHETTDPRSLDE